MGKEQRAVCSDGLVVEVEAAVWLKLGLTPSGAEEADSGRICGTTAVWIGVTSRHPGLSPMGVGQQAAHG